MVEFEKSPLCETPSACPLLEACQRAVVITREAVYVHEGRALSVQELENSINAASCDHEQVPFAVEFAKNVAQEKRFVLNISPGGNNSETFK